MLALEFVHGIAITIWIDLSDTGRALRPTGDQFREMIEQTIADISLIPTSGRSGP
jgi:hypothetical protein